MDRELSTSTIRSNRLRQGVKIAVPVLVIAGALVALPGWLRPSLDRTRIRTASVTTGSLEAIVSAAGTVIPAVERVLSSPVDARLLRLLKRPGAAVTAGEPVAELDLSDSRLAIERITRDLGITDNQQAQARLALERSLQDLDARIERQALSLEMLEQRAASNQRLSEQGLVSAQALEEARLAVKQGAIELAQLRRERDAAQQSTRLQSEELTLRRDALGKEEEAARRTLDLATTRSDRDGIVTWLLSQEGALVRRGDVIARIADLSSFRVEATVSDIHAARVRPGVPVNVIVGETALAGTIADVQPNVENNVVRFSIALAEPSHATLRPSMRVDVQIVTDRRARVLKVRQGPFLTGASTGELFVIRDDRAIRTPVEFGIRGADEVEIVSGLVHGDEVIISDMRSYMTVEQLEVR
jgi:HlyD family secretion protein